MTNVMFCCNFCLNRTRDRLNETKGKLLMVTPSCYKLALCFGAGSLPVVPRGRVREFLKTNLLPIVVIIQLFLKKTKKTLQFGTYFSLPFSEF